MTPEQAIDYAGGRQVHLASLLKVSPQVVSNWLSREQIPLAYQVELNAISNGVLKIDRMDPPLRARKPSRSEGRKGGGQ